MNPQNPSYRRNLKKSPTCRKLYQHPSPWASDSTHAPTFGRISRSGLSISLSLMYFFFLPCSAFVVYFPQVSHCGGISELHRIASLAETYDVALAPQCPNGPISLAASMQVAISAPNCEYPFNLCIWTNTHRPGSRHARNELPGKSKSSSPSYPVT